jgi:hypothetical protein
MNAEIESLYQPIGQALMDLLPEEFQQAWLNTEQQDGVAGTDVIYQDASGAYQYINEVPEDLDMLLIELRSAYRKSGQEPWSTATFWLDGTGGFRLDVGYEDVSDFGLTGERRAAWIAKYLGAGALLHR